MPAETVAFHAAADSVGSALAPSMMSISPPTGQPESVVVQNAGHCTTVNECSWFTYGATSHRHVIDIDNVHPLFPSALLSDHGTRHVHRQTSPYC